MLVWLAILRGGRAWLWFFVHVWLATLAGALVGGVLLPLVLSDGVSRLVGFSVGVSAFVVLRRMAGGERERREDHQDERRLVRDAHQPD